MADSRRRSLKLPTLWRSKASARRVPELWPLRRSPSDRSRLIGANPMLPIAVDAMGGDNAPHAIVQGAIRAHEENGTPIVLVGRPDEIGDTGGLPVIAASEVIAMDADPGSSVRTMKDSSLVRAAEAVRDGNASAMISAGNTGATMASALLRTGRIKGVKRPAIATPIPGPTGTPTILLDAGANACLLYTSPSPRDRG